MKSQNLCSAISSRCALITKHGSLIPLADQEVLFERLDTLLKDVTSSLSKPTPSTSPAPDDSSTQALLAVGADHEKIYLTLWSGDTKLVKEMGPLAAIYLASRLLREATPLMTDHEPVKPVAPPKDKRLSEMTNAEVLAEWSKWDDQIKNATGWGAAVGAADEFRTDAARELHRRGIEP